MPSPVQRSLQVINDGAMRTELDSRSPKVENPRNVCWTRDAGLKQAMPTKEFDLAHFFAWARLRAYRELEVRLSADPQLDPNWTFSDIMQELLDEFRHLKSQPEAADEPSETNEIDAKVNLPGEIN